MDSKPLWLSYAVDAAQICSAIFTAAAVFAAIWLARRSEMQRLKLGVHYHIELTIGGDTKEGEHEKHFLALTLVNAGVLPIVVEHATACFQLKGEDRYALGLGTFDPQKNKATFPIKLEHGQSVQALVPVLKGTRPWNNLRFLWWLLCRPEFLVTTSLGKRFRVKPKIRLLRRLNRKLLK